ncbi:nop2 (nucleomorph) [Hemiselmis andersenii]|uniref:Nop2 n=2 Tax=Hemiselmis andersenii TaxID=464988 RepID=A9BKG1_HEMAN|nr:nop2 [Hemiselmis andersenii]ABW97994.1 nop2 [Hemiselmis andersenii]|mmetsp:Transcript_61396/g.147773  ORF Transcript_61396/g.147773 Transcript_61396/m.147773 type:complete len:367 (+) Transcript_61396:2332-3432(+)
MFDKLVQNNKKIRKKNTFNRRITHLISIIQNYQYIEWKTSKKYYLDLLKKEICLSYNYSIDLVEKFFNIIPMEEIDEFFKSNETPRPLTIRINSIRNGEENFQNNLRNMGIQKIFEEKLLNFAGIIKRKNIRLGKNPEFLAGYFTLQGLSSFFSVIALDPQKGERILEIAAAPGGKATFISQIMENTGICIANDKNKSRLNSLVSTIHRLGIENSIVTNFDGSFFHYKMKGFDRVLLDAPCTGTGIISHDERIKLHKINSAILINTTLQKRLLISAIDSCKINQEKKGYIVYSTCSILIEENESIIQYAVEKRNVKIVKTGLSFGIPGFVKYKNEIFNKKMHFCRRFYPHIHNVDGFFVCKLEKNK